MTDFSKVLNIISHIATAPDRIGCKIIRYLDNKKSSSIIFRACTIAIYLTSFYFIILFSFYILITLAGLLFDDRDELWKEIRNENIDLRLYMNSTRVFFDIFIVPSVETILLTVVFKLLKKIPNLFLLVASVGFGILHYNPIMGSWNFFILSSEMLYFYRSDGFYKTMLANFITHTVCNSYANLLIYIFLYFTLDF